MGTVTVEAVTPPATTNPPIGSALYAELSPGATHDPMGGTVVDVYGRWDEETGERIRMVVTIRIIGGRTAVHSYPLSALDGPSAPPNLRTLRALVRALGKEIGEARDPGDEELRKLGYAVRLLRVLISGESPPT